MGLIAREDSADQTLGAGEASPPGSLLPDLLELAAAPGCSTGDATTLPACGVVVVSVVSARSAGGLLFGSGSVCHTLARVVFVIQLCL